MIVGREGSGLDDKDVLTTNIFTDFYENFLIREPLNGGVSEWNVEILADRFGKMPVRIACENLHCGRLFLCL